MSTLKSLILKRTKTSRALKYYLLQKLTKRMSRLPDFALSAGPYYLVKHKNLGMSSAYRVLQDLLFSDIPRILQVDKDQDLSDKSISVNRARVIIKHY